jgi:hypothetical protein
MYVSTMLQTNRRTKVAATASDDALKTKLVAQYEEWLLALEHSISKPKFGKRRHHRAVDNSTGGTGQSIQSTTMFQPGGSNKLEAMTLSGQLRRPVNESLFGMKGGQLKSIDLLCQPAGTVALGQSGHNEQALSTSWWEPCVKVSVSTHHHVT